MLVSGHAMLASILRIPEIEIDRSEAKSLIEDAERIQAEFELPSVDAKTAVLLKTAGDIGLIYGTRLMAFAGRKRAEHQRNVTPHRPRPAAAPPGRPTPAAPATTAAGRPNGPAYVETAESIWSDRETEEVA